MDTAQKTTKWSIDYIDSGYCRIVYSTESGGRVCFQDEGSSIQCMTLTTEDEPITSIQLKPSAYSLFEVPTGNSDLESRIRNYLNRMREQK